MFRVCTTKKGLVIRLVLGWIEAGENHWLDQVDRKIIECNLIRIYMSYNLLSTSISELSSHPPPTHHPQKPPRVSGKKRWLSSCLLACHRIGKSSEVQQKIGQKNIQKSYCPGDREKKNNIARLCSVHQKMVRIGNFGASSRLSLALSQNSFAISLSYHGSSMVSKKTSRFLGQTSRQ